MIDLDSLKQTADAHGIEQVAWAFDDLIAELRAAREVVEQARSLQCMQTRKMRPVSCPDKKEGCLVGHYEIVPSALDLALAAYDKQTEQGE